MATYTKMMRTIGVNHIVDGTLLPILWGAGFAFPFPSLVGAPVWCGILAIASLVLNAVGIAAAIIVVICGAIITHTDLPFLVYYGGDVALDLIIILLALFELSVCIVGTVYSARIIHKSTAMHASTEVYSGGGVANPGMQNPGAQVQIQNPAQPVQGQYPDAPDQGQYPGPPAQGQYPGPPAQGQNPGSPAQEQYPGPPAQGQYPGSPAQGQYPGPPAQGQNPGSPAQGQYTGPAQGQYPGSPAQGQYPGPPAQGQYPGSPAQGQYQGPAQGQYLGPTQGQYPPGTTSQGQYTPTQAWQKH